MILIQRNDVIHTGSDRLFVRHTSPTSMGISRVTTHQGIKLDPHDFKYYYTNFKLELIK